nr:ATP/GTP-binding protein [Nocardia vaccinii]
MKIVIVGGFGVGKTTLVRSVSEIRPLDTEATMTDVGTGVDDPSAVPGKSTTTVAFDFGRITIDAEHVLYLFGAPGQERFWFLWDRLFTGALGAIVLVDPGRIADCWYAIDRLEYQRTPFVVACNDFGTRLTDPEEVRAALDLDPHVPLAQCDARSRDSGKQVLITLVEHLYAGAVPTPESAP